MMFLSHIDVVLSLSPHLPFSLPPSSLSKSNKKKQCLLVRIKKEEEETYKISLVEND